jgi:hypothetical protein
MNDLVLIPRAAELTGYSVPAIERKIERGQWRKGIEYMIAPDGHRMISLKAIDAWVLSGKSPTA